MKRPPPEAGRPFLFDPYKSSDGSGEKFVDDGAKRQPDSRRNPRRQVGEQERINQFVSHPAQSSDVLETHFRLLNRNYQPLENRVNKQGRIDTRQNFESGQSMFCFLRE